MENLKSWIATIRHMTEVRMFEEYAEKHPNGVPRYFNPEGTKKTRLKITPPLPCQSNYVDNIQDWREKVKVSDNDVLDTATTLLEKGRISEELFLSIHEALAPPCTI